MTKLELIHLEILGKIRDQFCTDAVLLKTARERLGLDQAKVEIAQHKMSEKIAALNYAIRTCKSKS